MATPHTESNRELRLCGEIPAADAASEPITGADLLRYSMHPLTLLADFPSHEERRAVLAEIDAEHQQLDRQRTSAQARWDRASRRRRGGFNALRVARATAGQ